MIDHLDDLLPDMALELPDCPEAMQKQSLRLAAREFCVETEAYQIELDPIDVVEDQTDYDLRSGTNGSIQRIIWVKMGENITDTTDSLDAGQYKLIDEFTLRLKSEPTEDITDGLEVKIALRPDFDADASLEPWFLERYSTVLAAGAKARLMRMGRKPWTDMNSAAFYANEFRIGKIDAIGEKYREHENVNIRVELERFAI